MPSIDPKNWYQRRKMSVRVPFPDGWIRLAVGLESVVDLKADLARGLGGA